MHVPLHSLSTSLPVFSIRMASVSLSLVKPALTRDLPKVRNLGLNPLVEDLFHRSLDLGKFASALLREEDDRSRQFAPQISRVFRDEFIPNRNLRRYLEQIDGYIQEDL